VAFGDKNLKVVSKFVYLGTWIWRYSEESKLQHLEHQTKLTIYKALIRPVLLYGSEEKGSPNKWPKKVDGGNSRSRYNVELNREFYITNVIGGPWRAGHMIRGTERQTKPKKKPWSGGWMA
jgi:hypothetical protein